MRVTAIESVLGGLRPIQLRALIPDREPYHAMLLQPQGVIEASSLRIGHADSAAGAAMCRAFLQMAVEKHADLIVTPEYCLPWRVVSDIVEGRVVPDRGAIWVFGCESIAPVELEALATRANNGLGYFYHEPIRDPQRAQKHYVDPLLYVFWCHNNTGQEILSFVVQFKTEPCRDRLDVEQRSLYLGENVYIFNRDVNKISLLSIICSDAFAFTDARVNEYHRNCLLIHIQLCPKPAHIDYAAYRMHLCSVGSCTDVELLCLNWAHGVTEIDSGGSRDAWNNISGSAWYVPPSKFNCDEHLVDAGHRAGVYYSLVAQRWHTFYLNYAPQILLLQKQKVLFLGQQALRPQSCLIVMDRWAWDQGGRAWMEQRTADDGFASIVSSYPALIVDLSNMAGTSPLAVERAIEFLVGPEGKPSTWFHLDELACIKVGADESINRVTVHQEDDTSRCGVVFRRGRLQRAQDAMTLSGQGIDWPVPLRDLKDGFRFQWSAAEPHRNVVSLDGGAPASLVFLADQADDAMIEPVCTKVQQALSQQAVEVAVRENLDAADSIVRFLDRLCVVFRRDHMLHVWSPGRCGRIDRPPTNSAVDITGGER